MHGCVEEASASVNPGFRRIHSGSIPTGRYLVNDIFYCIGAAARQKEYRALFRGALDEDFLADLRAATNGGWALGGERFKRAIAKALRRRVAPLPRGN
jgi:hypothetical protein